MKWPTVWGITDQMGDHVLQMPEKDARLIATDLGWLLVRRKRLTKTWVTA